MAGVGSGRGLHEGFGGSRGDELGKVVGRTWPGAPGELRGIPGQADRRPGAASPSGGQAFFEGGLSSACRPDRPRSDPIDRRTGGSTRSASRHSRTTSWRSTLSGSCGGVRGTARGTPPPRCVRSPGTGGRCSSRRRRESRSVSSHRTCGRGIRSGSSSFARRCRDSSWTFTSYLRLGAKAWERRSWRLHAGASSALAARTSCSTSLSRTDAPTRSIRGWDSVTSAFS
jgi:hypothetical protein